ncbi:MAG TPA: multidrug transporter subunit MdtD [Steroidobacteraceae bacterium]|nr:multidrug transporter subunit MdtD [Steroidobacteraceae bacterium]
MSPRPRPAPDPLRPLLWLVAAGFFMQTLDTTIVNTALPAMAASLGERPLRMQSVVIAYSLTMAMLIPASGYLADRFGTRRTFFSAIVVFTAGSVLCAASGSLPQLTAARVLQGAGGAMLMPVGRLAVLHAVPRERLLPAMSFMAIPGLIGPLIGPSLGGWLVQAASWHWIFLINVPIGLAGCVATLRRMPATRAAGLGPFDLAGYALLAAGMVGVSFALDGLSELSLHHATVLLLLVFGLVSLTGYWLRAAQQPHPLFPPRIFGTATFSIGLLGNLFARLGSGAMPFLLPLLLQVSLHYAPFHAGLMMLPVSLAAITSKRVVTPLIARLGYRAVLVTNTVLVGAAMASFALVSLDEPLWLILVQLAGFGIVNSLQFTAMNTVTLKDLADSAASSGNSLLSMVQMLSMSLAVASAGGMLQAFTDNFGGGAGLAVFHATFICVGVMTAVSAWIFWQLPNDEPARPGPQHAPELA